MTAAAVPQSVDREAFDARRGEITQKLAEARTHRAAIANRLDDAELREEFFSGGRPTDSLQLKRELAAAEEEVRRLERLKSAAENLRNEVLSADAQRTIFDALDHITPVLEDYDATLAHIRQACGDLIGRLEHLIALEARARQLESRASFAVLGMANEAGVPAPEFPGVADLARAFDKVAATISSRRRDDLRVARYSLDHAEATAAAREKNRANYARRIEDVRRSVAAAYERVKRGSR